MTKIRSLLLKYKYYVLVALMLMVLIYAFSSGSSTSTTTSVAQKSDLKEEVAVSGKVRAAQDVDLSLDKSVRIANVYYKVGDKVNAGDIIVSTDSNDLLAKLNSAKATLAKESIKLEQLKAGARPEEISIAEQGVYSASIDASSSERNLREKIQNAYIVADDAVHNKVDQFINSPTTVPSITIPVSDVNLVQKIKYQRIDIETGLNTLKNKTEINNVANNLQILTNVSDFLNTFSSAINSLTPSTAYPQETISSWKSNISSARSSLSVAIQNLIDANQKYINAISALRIATDQLNIKTTGGSSIDVRAQEAVVQGAQADVDSASAAYAKTQIIAPFDGIITRLDAETGGTINANQSFVSMISEGGLEVEAYIPEINISKVKANDSAIITLDAFGPLEIFKAHVSTVDLSEKVIDGVPAYKTRLLIDGTDPRIKVGMTANVKITTAEKKGVLNVPVSALNYKEGEFYVNKVVAGKKIETTVTTGIKAKGAVEILSGLNEGDVVSVDSK